MVKPEKSVNPEPTICYVCNAWLSNGRSFNCMICHNRCCWECKKFVVGCSEPGINIWNYPYNQCIPCNAIQDKWIKYIPHNPQ